MLDEAILLSFILHPPAPTSSILFCQLGMGVFIPLIHTLHGKTAGVTPLHSQVPFHDQHITPAVACNISNLTQTLPWEPQVTAGVGLL